MKTIITIAFLLCSIGVSAQTKTQVKIYQRLALVQPEPAITAQSLLLIQIGGNQTILKVHAHYKGISTFNAPVDSLTMYVRKSQIKWINDSTAIVYKP